MYCLKHVYRLGRAASLIVALSACYKRTPITTAVPTPETRIVARLTDEGVVQMGRAIGAGAYEIEGVIAEADPSVWKLRLMRVEQRTGNSINWNNEVVSFPRSVLTNAIEKRFDRTRSFMAAGLITGAAILAAAAFGAIAADEEDNPPPPPPAIRIPGGGLRINF